jgi:hypothetical protein
MAWYSKMIMPLRVLINDFDESSYKYSDDSLKKLLATSAIYVLQECSISNAGQYIIDFDNTEITPEPADQAFINFTVMKAACLTNQWQFNAKAISSGIRAVCGPVSMDVDSGGITALLALIQDGYCKAYEEMKKQHNFGNVSFVKAVLSPFAHSDYWGTSGYNNRSIAGNL